MNILLNFYPVRTGGGQQVASNFLKIISKDKFKQNWFVFVGEGSELHQIAKQTVPITQILSIKYNYQNRIFTFIKVKSFVNSNNIDIIYSYGPILPIKNIPQVLRSVYSNLYFPEIDFWKDYSFLAQLKRKMIDFFRLKQTLKADGLIFENSSMLERAVNLFNYPKYRVTYIEPSVSYFDESQLSEKYKELESIEEFKILYLSSWHLNKNIHILPEVAKILSSNNICKVKFILTIDINNSSVQKQLLNQIKKFKVENYFQFIGKVEAIYVHQVVKSSDAMILLSKLECFSSNVMEAFHFEKPLIISDEAWARSACLDAALYVERTNSSDIANKVNQLIDSQDVQRILLKNSRMRMESFNKPEQKVLKQVQFLEYIYKNYEKSN